MRRFGVIPIAFMLALPAALSLPDVAQAKPENGAVLTAIQEGAADGAYRLVCSGSCEHRLVQTADRLLVIIELPNVGSEVPPASLPAPRGLVRAIEIDTERTDATHVKFALLQPGKAISRPSDRGLELQIEARGIHGQPSGPAEHPVGAEDLLEITVFEIPELNRTVRVSEGGTISLPLLGEMMVRGLTSVQLEGKLREELGRKYLQDPQVSVFVRAYGSKTVSVIGAVGRPSVYEMLGPRTLLQVLSQAGGLRETAGAEIYVVRSSGEGESKRFAISIADLMSNRDPDLNIPIQPGDIISVPPDRAVFVYVDGAVRTPGLIEQMASRPITLLQAIAKAGGTTERANLKSVHLLRKGPDGVQVLRQLNLKRIRLGKDSDPGLKDGDIIVVPETFF